MTKEVDLMKEGFEMWEFGLKYMVCIGITAIVMSISFVPNKIKLVVGIIGLLTGIILGSIWIKGKIEMIK